MLTEIEIVKEVLVYLDGWETDDNNTDTINESAYMSTEEKAHLTVMDLNLYRKLKRN